MEVILLKYENNDDKYVDWEYDTKHCLCVAIIVLLRVSFILTHTNSNFLSVCPHDAGGPFLDARASFFARSPVEFFVLFSCRSETGPVIVRIHPGPH